MARQKIVLIFIIMIFLLITVRLFYWQIATGKKFAVEALSQYYYSLDLPAVRGQILAADGDLLVSNQNSHLIYAEIPKIKNIHEFAEKTAEVLDLDRDALESRLSQPNIVWALLKHKVAESTYQKLTTANLTGIGAADEGKRFYPEASMAAQLLGFVGSDDSGNDKGYFGIEDYYDIALKGKSGTLLQEKDARGQPILMGTVRRVPAQDGQSLKLYLNRTIQYLIESKLIEGIKKYGAKEGLVAVMDPNTGGILGAAAYPDYDPGEFAKYDPELFHNPLVAQTYEPGSTFKVLVMAAALNEKVIDPKTIYDESGPVQVGEYSIKTWNDKYNGKITATQILEKSSNPGMVFIGHKLGRDKMLQYIKNYGFGQPTGVDLDEEIPQLRPDQDWREIDLATVSFGQGIAVTPIQMLRAVAVLANDGKLWEPHVVEQIIDPGGKIINRQPKIQKNIISSATAKVITEMMVAAVDNGEAKWAKPAGYRIAGKTGTAQIPVAGHYDDKKTIASFVGFAPADNPKFVMLVLLREPTSSPWGSETAAPLFFNISRELFTYYGISPKD